MSKKSFRRGAYVLVRAGVETKDRLDGEVVIPWGVVDSRGRIATGPRDWVQSGWHVGAVERAEALTLLPRHVFLAPCESLDGAIGP